MGTMATVRVNTSQGMALYRCFVIQETDEGWLWQHEDFYLGRPVEGIGRTLFAAIDAVDAWYAQKEAA